MPSPNPVEHLITEGANFLRLMQTQGFEKKTIHHLPDSVIATLMKLDLGTITLPSSGKSFITTLATTLEQREATLRAFSKIISQVNQNIDNKNKKGAFINYEKAHNLYRKLSSDDQSNLYDMLEGCYLRLHPYPLLLQKEKPAQEIKASDSFVEKLRIDKQQAIANTKAFIAHEESIRELEKTKTEHSLREYNHKIHEATLRLAELEEHHFAILSHHKKIKDARKSQEKLASALNELEDKKQMLEHEISSLHIESAKSKREISQLTEKKQLLLRAIDTKEFELLHITEKVKSISVQEKTPKTVVISPDQFAQTILHLTQAISEGEVDVAQHQYQVLRDMYGTLPYDHKRTLYPAILRLQKEFTALKEHQN